MTAPAADDDPSPFVIAVLADLSRDARPEAARHAVPGELHAIRRPGDVSALCARLRPRLRVALPAPASGAPVADAELTVGDWADLDGASIAQQLRRGGVASDDLPAAVAAVRRHAGWRALEATWRGLHHLAHACGDGGDTARPVVVRVLDVAARAVTRDVQRSVDPLATRTFQRLAEVPWSEPTASTAPVALLVWDEPVVGDERSGLTLEGLTAMAAALHAPLLAAASPELLSYDGFGALAAGRVDGIAHRLELAERRRVRALQERPEARFTWLLVPRVRLHPAADASSTAAASAHPRADVPDALFGNAAFDLAARVGALVRDTGAFAPAPATDLGATPAEVDLPRPIADALVRERLAVVDADGVDRLPSWYRPGARATTLDLQLHDALWIGDLVHRVHRHWQALGDEAGVGGAAAAGVAVADRLARMREWLASWTGWTAGPGSPGAPGAGRQLSVRLDADPRAGIQLTLTVGGRSPDIPGGGSFVTRSFLSPLNVAVHGDAPRFPRDLADRSTAEWVRLEASGQFALRDEWADALWYVHAIEPVGGIGAPVLALGHTAPLVHAPFHGPPPGGERLYGAVGLTATTMRWEGQTVTYDAATVARAAAASAHANGTTSDTLPTAGSVVTPDGPRPPRPPSVFLVAARARVVSAIGVNGSIPPAFRRPERYRRVEIDTVTDVRPLWVALDVRG